MAQFGAYLDEVDDESESAPAEDAFSLFAELAGLKNEVKREARQVKEAIDQFSSVFSTLQTSNEALGRELESRRQGEQGLRRDTLRPLLYELLELRDRVEAGLELSAPPKRSLLGHLFRRHNERLDALREGQRMTLRRLDRVLGNYRVRPVEAVNKPLDPHIMRVVEVEFRTDRPQGIVISELRKGFFWDEELLRTAEVKVNKRGDNP